MTGSIIFCICLAYFALAYLGYGSFLKRLFAINPQNPTPAYSEFDGVDFVPTKIENHERDDKAYHAAHTDVRQEMLRKVDTRVAAQCSKCQQQQCRPLKHHP